MRQVPKSIKNVNNDYVRYEVFQDGKEVPNTSLYYHQIDGDKFACYGTHIHLIGFAEFYCKPSSVDGKSPLSEDCYLRWINLGKMHHMIPSTVVTERKSGGNYLRVFPGNYHHVYVALCFHRWAECKAEMVWSILDILDSNPTLNFFQVLHYAFGKNSISSGHGFFNLVILYNHRTQGYCYWLPASVACCVFFKPTQKRPEGYAIPDKNFVQKPYYYAGTAPSINSMMITEMRCPAPYHGLLSESNVGKPVLPDLCVANYDHILWDEWSELYTMNDPTKEQMVVLYREVMKRRGIK
jgi:hypothetical protein